MIDKHFFRQCKLDLLGGNVITCFSKNLPTLSVCQCMAQFCNVTNKLNVSQLLSNKKIEAASRFLIQAYFGLRQIKDLNKFFICCVYNFDLINHID